MAPQEFMLLNIGIVIVLVIWFFMARKPMKQPSRLKMRGSNNEIIEPKGGLEIKNINVVFNYNGHSWDAYEVLGLTYGASLEEIKNSFNESLRKTQPESHEFLRTALEAILKDLKGRGLTPK